MKTAEAHNAALTGSAQPSAMGGAYDQSLRHICETGETLAALRAQRDELQNVVRTLIADVRLSKRDHCLAAFSLSDYNRALVAVGLKS